MSRILPFCLLAAVLGFSCSSEEPKKGNGNDAADDDGDAQVNAPVRGIQKEPTVEGPDGTPLNLFHLTNKNGLVVTLLDWGATVTNVTTPDRDGTMANICLSHPKMEGYFKNAPYFGATVGRYANRIAKGRFTIGETEYVLATNNGENHLHGGEGGLHRVVWASEELEGDDFVGVKFSYTSPDGADNYPGNLNVEVVYKLTDEDELSIDYTAHCDKDTHVNLTNHTYWNLGGAEDRDETILDHVLMLDADKFLPVDSGMIPTGELADVTGTPMDFRKATPIGERIGELPGDPDAGNPGGYDHCWVVNGEMGELRLAASVTDPDTGRAMDVLTTEPGIQFYAGNFLDGSPEVGGYEQRCGFCLETQHFPDSPNQPDFPSTLLKKGEVFQSKTVHKFYTK